MAYDLGDCAVLVRNLKGLGVAVPEPLTAVLDKSAALRAALDDDPTDDLKTATTDGTMTPATAAKLLDKAALRVATRASAADLVRALQRPLAKEFAGHVLADAGAEIITSLRPKFDAAATAIAEGEIETSTTAEQAIELGDDTARAWRDLPRHRATLDQIVSLVAEPLVRTFDVLGHRSYLNPSVPILAFLLDPDHRPDVQLAAALFSPPYGRSGPWIKLVRGGVGTLRLNTPAEAIALLDAHDAAVTERDEQVRAASTPVGYEQAHAAAVQNGGRITSLMSKV